MTFDQKIPKLNSRPVCDFTVVGMISDQNSYDVCYVFFYPTASATAYGQRPKFVRVKHTATAEGENWAYGLTLQSKYPVLD